MIVGYMKSVTRTALAAAVSSILLAAQQALAASASIPVVEPVLPDGNLPFNSALFSGSLDYGDFARYGYVEKEFYFSGKASTRDQETGEIIKADLPYVSRMVVRMPANPKAFSGNVVIEPFHGILEKTDIWEQLHHYIVESGDVWVGYTQKAYGLDMEPTSAYSLGGVPALKAYDPVRYGRLNLEPDMRPLAPAPPAPMPPQALDLMTQVGALLKSNDPGSPLKGLTVKKVYAAGAGINGEVVAGYLRTGRHDEWTLPNGGQIFDGYFYGIMGRYPPPPPKNAVLVLYRGTNETDRAATSGYYGKAPNTPAYRVYSVIGMSHLNARNLGDSESVVAQINGVLPQPNATMPSMPWVFEHGGGCPNLNDEPVDLFLDAVYVRMMAWGKNGTPLPESPEPVLLPGDPGAPPGSPTGSMGPHDKRVNIIKKDTAGNMMGGIRMPWVEAPVAMYPVFDPNFGPPAVTPGDIIHGGGALPAGAPPPGPPQMPHAAGPVVEPSDAWPFASKTRTQLPTRPAGGMNVCFLANPRLPLDQEVLHKLYKSYDDYVQQFEAAKARAVKAGWLLKEDSATVRPRGNPSDFNW